MIDALLSINIRNRIVAKGHVSALADAMKRGEFVSENGQTIVVNDSCTWLLDGQHRLLANKEAGYPEMLFDLKFVHDEMAEIVFKTIDTAERTRTVSFVLASMESNKKEAQFVAKAATVMNYFFEIIDHRTKVPADTVAKHIDANRPVLKLIITGNTHERSFASVPFLAGCFSACQRNKGNIAEIIERISDVKNNTVNGKVMPGLAALRSFIEKHRVTHASRHEIFIKTVKALEDPLLSKLVIKEATARDFRCDY